MRFEDHTRRGARDHYMASLWLVEKATTAAEMLYQAQQPYISFTI